jgi:GH35 family endo-1,4-beta-xylanase
MERLINSQNAAKRNIVRQMLEYVQEKGEPLNQID